MKTLKNLFLNALAGMHDAERRIVKALPKLARAATSEALKGAIQSHLGETENHVKKLEQVFRSVEEKPRGKTCEATVGLLKEADEIAADFKGSPAINAALIAAAQKVEHYEIASYGCLREWAETLGNEPAVGLLQEILDEEKAANEALNELARASSNVEALREVNEAGRSEETEGEQAATPRRGIHPAKTRENPGEFERLLSGLVAANQAWARTAPVLVLSVVSLRFAENKQDNRAAVHDLGLAAGNLSVEATARGLSVHQMIGILPDQAREVYRIPEHFEAWTALAIGYKADPAMLPESLRTRDLVPRERKRLSKFVFTGRWGQPSTLALNRQIQSSGFREAR